MSRLEKLTAYVTREMSDAEADAFEDALFDAPEDADIAFLDRVARHGATLVEHGTWNVGATRAEVDALFAAGHRISVYDPGPPGSGTVSWNPDCDMLLTKLRIGRTDVPRVDVEVHVVSHNVTKTIKDVVVDDGIVYGLCEIALAKIAWGAGRTITKVRRADGAREVLAEWDLFDAGPQP